MIGGCPVTLIMLCNILRRKMHTEMLQWTTLLFMYIEQKELKHEYLCISLQYNGFGVKPICVPERADLE